MISIIVPTYLMSPAVYDVWATNRGRIVEVAAAPYEIVVIDNASAYPPPAITTAFMENRGIAPAWNEGVRRAKGDVLCFLTCTTHVEPGWDTKLAAVARAGRYVAMPFTNGEKAYGLGITGWCWMVRRDVFEEVGPFDETFVPVQYEDSDWFWRAIQQGIELVNVPGANVTRTQGRQTLQAAPWAKRLDWIHWSNRLRFSFKWGNDPTDTLPFWKAPLRDVTA